MNDVADIAGQLTKVQRLMVLTDDHNFSEQWRGYWSAGTSSTGKVLHRLGLVEEPSHLTKPTLLGKQVRAHIQGNPHD